MKTALFIIISIASLNAFADTYTANFEAQIKMIEENVESLNQAVAKTVGIEDLESMTEQVTL